MKHPKASIYRYIFLVAGLVFFCLVLEPVLSLPVDIPNYWYGVPLEICIIALCLRVAIAKRHGPWTRTSVNAMVPFAMGVAMATGLIYLYVFSVPVSYHVDPQAGVIRVYLDDTMIILQLRKGMQSGESLSKRVYMRVGYTEFCNGLDIEGKGWGRVAIRYRGQKIMYHKYRGVDVEGEGFMRFMTTEPHIVRIGPKSYRKQAP